MLHAIASDASAERVGPMPSQVGRFTINSTEHLRTVLCCEPEKITSPGTTHLWLADFGHAMIHAGSWSAPHWNDNNFDPEPDKDRLELWLRLLQLIVQRTTSLDELAIHSSVVLHLKKVDMLWSANGEFTGFTPEEDYSLNSTGWIYINAHRVKVRHLKTWGNVLEEVLLDRITSIESFSIRGCRHSFEYRNFGRLIENVAPRCERIELTARGDVDVRHLAFWLEKLGWVQRARSRYTDRQPYRFIDLVLPGALIEEHGKWIDEMWSGMNTKYTQNARLTVSVNEDDHPELTQTDHDLWEFNIDPFSRDPASRPTPYPGSLCFCKAPHLPAGEPALVAETGPNAYGLLTEDDYCLKPSEGASANEELEWTEEELFAEFDTEAELEKMVYSLPDNLPLIRWRSLQEGRQQVESDIEQAKELLKRLRGAGEPYPLSALGPSSPEQPSDEEREAFLTKFIGWKIESLATLKKRIEALQEKHKWLKQQSMSLPVQAIDPTGVESREPPTASVDQPESECGGSGR